MARVLPLYRRWMAALPTLADAAGASRADVLRLWGDAGYPRRAVAMREAARIVVWRHGGALPRDGEALRALPGVGPFTAAVVLCFGYGEHVPVVDVNVTRVLGRAVLGELEPVASLPRVGVELLAVRMLPAGEAAKWNPALMDLGAAVCRARPRCDLCPLARLCAARPRFARGEHAATPRRQRRYEGSDRQWRGRILRALRGETASSGDPGGAALGSVGVRALLGHLATTPEERARVRHLLDVLVAEGLAWRAGGRCGLGEAPVAAAADGTGLSAGGRRATLDSPRPQR